MVGVALCCVPVMLFGKPLARKLRQNRQTGGADTSLRKDSTRKLQKSKNIVSPKSQNFREKKVMGKLN